MQQYSALFIVKNSPVHGNGVFAKVQIPKGTKIIEYVGEKITKEEGTRRAQLQEHNCSASNGAVYVFELDENWDIDGNVIWNTARLINHSCEPNCKFLIEEGHIWIVALHDILEGEELSYDYGFDIEDYKKHTCKCGKPSCIGYIVAKEHWGKIKI